MNNNLRFELSFKDIIQLEKKLKFCISNKIKCINIPCKGIIKKEFLKETIEFIGDNYKELDVIYHYSLFHQYTSNSKKSYLEFLSFINRCLYHKNNEILLISGSNKKREFEVLDVLKKLKNKKSLNIKIGIAYNPYLSKFFNNSEERTRFQKKISSGLIKSIWLQFGTDIKLLESEFCFLKKTIKNCSNKNQENNIKIFGSLLIPSKQFIARFKFRPWKGVYISEKYLCSLDKFNSYTKELVEFYLDNNICPLIETDFSSSEKLEDIYNLFNI